VEFYFVNKVKCILLTDVVISTFCLKMTQYRITDMNKLKFSVLREFILSGETALEYGEFKWCCKGYIAVVPTLQEILCDLRTHSGRSYPRYYIHFYGVCGRI